MKWNRWVLALVLAGLWPGLAAAAELDGSQLSALWAVPFASLLLSIAVMPLAAPFFWHHHFGTVAAGWSLAFLLPFAMVFGPAMAGVNLVHALLAEYIALLEASQYLRGDGRHQSRIDYLRTKVKEQRCEMEVLAVQLALVE